ncbi:MAG: hypothetical protein K2X66_18805, partial [Cyanobacteria bacterium]|nr:hypothetical protein [Cyanobacteriota bacterium]
MPLTSLCTYDLAEELCELSLQIRRPVSLLMDAKGHVKEVAVCELEAFDKIPQLAKYLPLQNTQEAKAQGVLRYYVIQTHLATQWKLGAESTQISIKPLGLGLQTSILQFHFPVVVVLKPGVEEGFSGKFGEHPTFCDGGILLHPHWEEASKSLAVQTKGPMTARSFEKESGVDWFDWGDSIFINAQSLSTGQGERVFLIGVHEPGAQASEASARTLAELKELASTAGATVKGEIFQTRQHPDPKTYIGKGKAEEIAPMLQQMLVDTVIADDTLSPTQQRNLEAVLKVKVIDRTELILDIFAQRAKSKEGQIQVELAQLKYLLPRLAGRGLAFSQQTSVGAKGGIATRG